MNDQKPIIEIKNLTKTYRTDRKRSIVERFRRRASGSTEDFHALKNVSLTVQSGRIFVIMGLSGSGKSTLLRCVNRLLEPSEGEVTIDGKNVIGLTNKELRHLRATKLSMVFQHFALLPHMSVVDNVAFGLRIAGVPVKERRARATEILNLVGLSGWEHRRPSELSGGMRQRLGIARALVMDTPILLMDEPFSALDPLIRAELQQELLRLQRSLHKTIVFVTHDPNEAAILGDDLVILKDGEIVQQGAAKDVLLKPQNDYVKRFIEGVDKTRLLTAEHGLDREFPVTVADTAHPSFDKPSKYGGLIAVVDSDRRPIGIIRSSSADQTYSETAKRHLISDFIQLQLDSPLAPVLPQLSGHATAALVVNEEGRFIGAVTAHSVVRALQAQ